MRVRTRALRVLAAATFSACGLATGGCTAVVPSEVAFRKPLPSCGSEVLTRDGGFNVDGRRCLWDAHEAGRPAEFVSTERSVEGDPVTYIYRVLGPGQVVVFVDTTRDRYGSRGWEKYTGRALRRFTSGRVDPDFGIDASFTESAAH